MRKILCIGSYIVSGVLLCAVPAAAKYSHHHVDNATAIAMLVAAWCFYHLAEYFGTVATVVLARRSDAPIDSRPSVRTPRTLALRRAAWVD